MWLSNTVLLLPFAKYTICHHFSLQGPHAPPSLTSVSHLPVWTAEIVEICQADLPVIVWRAFSGLCVLQWVSIASVSYWANIGTGSQGPPLTWFLRARHKMYCGPTEGYWIVWLVFSLDLPWWHSCWKCESRCSIIYESSELPWITFVLQLWW